MFKRLWRAIVNFFKGDKSEDITPQPHPSVSIPVQPGPSSLEELKVGDIGVDISHHNAKVNLKELVDHVYFIYMKATEGASFLSPTYVTRAKKLNELGALWGAYHYYRIQTDPILQAKHFVKYSAGWKLPPVLDIEAISNDGYTAPKDTQDLLRFLRYVEEHTGFTPVVYTSFYYARDVIKPNESFSKYPLWLAWYTEDFSRVKVPSPWQSIKLWQKTEHGRIKGVKGDVDVNEVMS